VSYSGLIYAAIVACWAAVLVPRWIRRNEEVERAREEDAARGVRVLQRRQVHGRHGPGHATLAASWSPMTTRAAGFTLNGTPVANSSVVAAGNHDDAPEADQEPVAAQHGDALEFDVPVIGSAARRRRRVLTLLVITLAVVCLAVAAGRLPPTVIAVAAGLLAGFLMLARRAAVAEARRRAHVRRVLAQRRAQAEARERAAAAASASGKRVAVLDEPEPVEPADPNAWEPVPVPLPTYLTKAKAEAPVIRKIDLTSPGAWTSGRLNPAGSIALPPPSLAEDDDLPEQRRAVGG
jgi:type II secretory pathway pseudopilin PulG